MKLQILALLALASISNAQDKKVLCYFESWATYRPGIGKYDVENIDPFLCTHLTFAFAGVDEGTHEIKILDPYNEACGADQKCAYGRFTDLKRYNPGLKTILAVGGWNEGSTTFSDMASSASTRAVFIQSALDMILQYNFDGLDMDWEYPGGRDDSPGDPENDKANFASLLAEMRAAFDAAEASGQTGDLGRLIITAAVSAGWETIDLSYDIAAINQYVDIINVMTYDYHGWFGGDFPYTGHHAPQYALPEELDPESDFYGFNMNFSINYWLDGGADPSKILLGVPTYGRGFILADPSDNGFYALATGPNAACPYTREAGFCGYNEYCEVRGSYTVVRDDPYVVSPYGYSGNDWLGYDDPASAGQKAQYALDMGLGGVFIWSLDTDDFQNTCGEGTSPILTTLVNVVNGGPMTTPPGYTIPTTSTTTTPPWWTPTTDGGNGGSTDPPPPDTTEGGDGTTDGGDGTTSGSGGGDDCMPDPNVVCAEDPGVLYDNPCDCEHYYQCQGPDPGTGDWQFYEEFCPSGTAFNPDTHVCDFPDNVEGCS